jgi:hypothetical protein
VADAQKKLEALLDSGIPPEKATQQIYDLLIQQSNTPRQAMIAAFPAAEGETLQAANTNAAQKIRRDARAINITELMAKVDNSTVRNVSERRVEFYTTDGFPCLGLATASYSAGITGGIKCRRRAADGRGRLLLHIPKGDAAQQQQQQQQMFDQPTRLHGTSYPAAAAAAAGQQPFNRRSMLADLLQPPDSGSSHSRSLLQATPQTQCSRPKGSALIISPFYDAARLMAPQKKPAVSVDVQCGMLQG